MKNLVRMSLFLSCVLAMPALAEDVAVLPGESEEKCFFMRAGQSGQYEFSASAMLEFNLHFHTRYVRYLVDPVLLDEGSDQFVVPHNQTYCLMWTNNTEEEVALQYSYSLQDLDANNPAQTVEDPTPGLAE